MSLNERLQSHLERYKQAILNRCDVVFGDHKSAIIDLLEAALAENPPKEFYSICSAHQVSDPNCPTCKVGSWENPPTASEPVEQTNELRAAAKELVERFTIMGFGDGKSVERLRRALEGEADHIAEVGKMVEPLTTRPIFSTGPGTGQEPLPPLMSSDVGTWEPIKPAVPESVRCFKGHDYMAVLTSSLGGVYFDLLRHTFIGFVISSADKPWSIPEITPTEALALVADWPEAKARLEGILTGKEPKQ